MVLTTARSAGYSTPPPPVTERVSDCFSRSVVSPNILSEVQLYTPHMQPAAICNDRSIKNAVLKAELIFSKCLPSIKLRDFITYMIDLIGL